MHREGSCAMDLILFRFSFCLVLCVVCFVLQPFGLTRWISAGLGAAAACLVILFELRVRALSLRKLFGAVIGSTLGIVGAFLTSLVLRNSMPPGPTQGVLQIFVLLLMGYVGLVIGTHKGDLLNLP